MKVVPFTLFCLFLAIAYEAKVYSICDFYYALKPLGLDPFKGIFAEQYLCAADQSSKLDTFYYENIDGVPRYGIFQLSGLEWCDNGRHSSQNKCHTHCDNFLDDNITDDVLCVKTIVNSTEDMSAWPLCREK
nr:sperm acrosome-associated protein 5-like [Zootoca vivipara]